MSAPVDVLAVYRVRYSRASDGAEFTRDFSTHVAAKAFAQRKKAEPGWRASWPTKIEHVSALARCGGAS